MIKTIIDMKYIAMDIEISYSSHIKQYIDIIRMHLINASKKIKDIIISHDKVILFYKISLYYAERALTKYLRLMLE